MGIMNSLKKLGGPFDILGTGNIFCIGDASNGKSVFLQALMGSVLDSGGRVFLLGGAWHLPVWSSSEAEVIQIMEREGLSFNPFSRIIDEDIVWDDPCNIIFMIGQVISSMISDSGKLEDVETALLHMALTAVIKEKGANTEVSDVAAWFLTHADRRARDMGSRLYEFTKDGSYGKFFTGPSTINYSGSFIVADFEDIKRDGRLCPVVLQSLIVNIMTMMNRGGRMTKFAIVIDDSWQFLGGKSAEALIVTVARQVRSLGGILVAGSSDINDLEHSLAAKAAFDHSPMKCFLPMDEESIKTVEAQRYIASPREVALLRGLSVEPEHYSEALIFGVSGYGVGRLVFNPFSLTFRSLKLYETEEILTVQGGSFSETIGHSTHTTTCPACHSIEQRGRGFFSSSFFGGVLTKGLGMFLATFVIASAALDQVTVVYSHSDSLPYRTFLELKRIKPQVGQYAYFESPWYGGRVIKKIVGREGDKMAYDAQGNLWVGNQKIGKAKPQARDGRRLTPIKSGVIPQGMVFVKGEHERSFDSRYEELGLIPESALGGRVLGLV